MITILLDEISNTAEDFRESSMAPVCFEHIIKLLEQDNVYGFNLWVDRKEIGTLSQYIDLLEEKKMHANVSLGATVGKDVLDILIEKTLPITIDAQRIFSSKNGQMLKCLRKAYKINLFLTVPSVRFDPQYLEKIFQSQLDINELTIGIGWQHQLSGPSKLPEKTYEEWSKLILTLAGKLTQKKIPFRFMCGLPLCLFQREQLGSMSTTLVKWPMAICRESLIIRSDGAIGYCPRIENPRSMNILKEKSISTISSEFDQWLLPFKGFCPAHPDPCRSFHTRACGGGCLADTFSTWQGAEG